VAGFRSESVAGFLLELVAGFVGIRRSLRPAALAENAKAYDYALRFITTIAGTLSHGVPHLRSRVSPRRWRKYPNKRPYCRDQDSSPMGPACVKSRIGRKSVESFSLLSSRDGSCLHCSISNRQNRDGSSKSKLNFRLFTQSGPAAASRAAKMVGKTSRD